MPHIGSYEENENKVSKNVVKAVGNNPVSNKVKEDMDDRKKRMGRAGVFEGVYKLMSAAEDLYVEDDMSFDKVISSLSAAISKLSGKEGEFKKAAKKEEKEEAEA